MLFFDQDNVSQMVTLHNKLTAVDLTCAVCTDCGDNVLRQGRQQVKPGKLYSNIETSAATL